MEKIKETIIEQNPSSFTDYISLYKKISKDVEKIKTEKNIKIAILSSFTFKGIEEILFVKCCKLGVIPKFFIGDYNQYHQEILDEKRGLYKFDADIIILFIDLRSLLGEQFFLPYQLSDDERKQWIDEKLSEIQSLIDKIKENSSAKVILHNFEVPLHSPLGIAESKQKFGFIESIEFLNSELKNLFKSDSQVFIFDYNSFSSKIGKQNIMDHKMYYLGDMKVDMKYLPELCESYLSYVKPVLSLTKKCIVLDLDNTLWGGIVGEDGLEGIKLGPTPEGRPFMEFQKYLLSLFNRGIILAINSKNNFDDAMQVLKDHPHMVLKEKHFASMRINWDDKISNMKSIVEELNIGLDSFVFFDDVKLNREMIKDALPEVFVVDLPDDPSLYVDTIMNLQEFNTFQITEEDRKKGRMYAERRSRKIFKKTVTDITEYLKRLDMIATIEKANSFNIPRISQMTQKTNQFNMTTRRYLEEDIKKFSNDKNHLVASIKIEDKFGDNGITGVAIVEKEKDKWKIDTFLLSCRVIGRNIENSLLAYIVEQANKENVKEISAEFISTKKNAPAKDFYKNNNFKLVNEKNDLQEWRFDLSKQYPYPDFIKIVKEE